MIRFAVEGVPIQQGSARAFVVKGRAVITSDTRRNLKDWRRAISTAAQRAAGGKFAPKGTPVGISVTFVMPRPKTMPKGRLAPTVTPDLDKLLRAAMDALTRTGNTGLYEDDAQVVAVKTRKVYAAPGGKTGAEFEIEFDEGLL